MKSMLLNTKNGYTLVEVTVVLVILAIISAVVISRSGSFSTDLVSQTEILKTHLRYAQTMGMSGTDSNDVFGIKCDTNFYWMFKGTNPDSKFIMLPDDQQYNTGPDYGKLNLSRKRIVIDPGFTVFFDQRGIPYSSYPGTPIEDLLSIDVKKWPGGETAPDESITIAPLTGFIQ
jgi:prepilin-type N-terminal cleavage/methylation domain-containing protein